MVDLSLKHARAILLFLFYIANTNPETSSVPPVYLNVYVKQQSARTGHLLSTASSLMSNSAFTPLNMALPEAGISFLSSEVWLRAEDQLEAQTSSWK